MAIQWLKGEKSGKPGSAKIVDLNENQGPSAAFELCYVKDENDKLPIKQPTEE